MTNTAITADDFTAIDKGDMVYMTTAKGDLAGTFISINSKGVNLNVDGKTVSRSLNSITRVWFDSDEDGDLVPADMFEDGEMYSAAQLAAAIGVEAFDFRQALRDMGQGVGRGRRYGFDAQDARDTVARVRAHLGK